MPTRTAVIIGAGPAGLTAALELARRSDIRPLVLEASGDNGGISKTIDHHGNRIDIGGHRFFSKSDRVMAWWLEILPLQRAPGGMPLELDIRYHQRARPVAVPADGPDPEREDEVMLVRHRVSRIFYDGKFYDYPLSLNLTTLAHLGPGRVMRIGLSYLRARLFPIRPERSLEDFFINRFGRELYATFFRDYTEKVWGVPCHRISAEWGAQRIKGLSIGKAIGHALRGLFRRRRSLGQKDTETSLIEHFLYPKYGPGQMWDTVARKVTEAGGVVRYHHKVVGLKHDGRRIQAAIVEDLASGRRQEIAGEWFFSTMPVKDLVAGLQPPAPAAVRQVAEGLVYRDFITVGLLVRRLALGDDGGGVGVPDNWIYIQEPHVKIGRLQIFNNWSPYMVRDPDTVWLGLEYFCDEGDALWSMDDRDFIDFAAGELETLGIIRAGDVLDSVLVRMPKTYPAYFGSYDQMPVIRAFLDPIENLFLIGRNGMHKYNNQDHSMLTAMTAVEQLLRGDPDKAPIWAVNTEMEYHESKS